VLCQLELRRDGLIRRRSFLRATAFGARLGVVSTLPSASALCYRQCGSGGVSVYLIVVDRMIALLISCKRKPGRLFVRDLSARRRRIDCLAGEIPTTLPSNCIAASMKLL